MDSDPEPRSAPSSPTPASLQAEDTQEEPPSPLQSFAVVLGPLIAALTLIVPFGTLLADRQGTGHPVGSPPRQALVVEGHVPAPVRVLRPHP